VIKLTTLVTFIGRIMRDLLEAGADPLKWFSLSFRECVTTAPMAACYLGSAAMLELLFSHGITADDAFSEMYDLEQVSRGHTLLVTAAGQECEGARDVVLLLLGRGVQVDGKDGYGLSALHSACDTGSADVARILLAAGASVNIGGYKAVLPDGLDQLAPRKVLITVILTTVNGTQVCNRD
jgi:ankyrin repeat protein